MSSEIAMRYSPKHNQETRERILTVAARLFREEGIAAVGLAKIMTEAGLTIGAFYTHFESKEALVCAALQRSFTTRNDELKETLRKGDLETAVRQYLSVAHRDHPGVGCPTAALVPELSRHSRATRQTYASGLEPSLDAWRRAMSTNRGKKVGRTEATAFLGLLVGTLQIARALTDATESAAVLEAGVQAALRLAGRTPH